MRIPIIVLVAVADLLRVRAWGASAGAGASVVFQFPQVRVGHLAGDRRVGSCPVSGISSRSVGGRKCELASRIGRAVVIDGKLPVVADAESMLAKEMISLRGIERNAARVGVVWLKKAKSLSVERPRLG